jgi:manganese efflux pump family protein
VNAIISTIIVGVSLSMDAFSLALAYGTVGLSKKNKIILSIIVGCFHFFMPLMGLMFGNIITTHFIIHVNVMVAVIFGIIGAEMIISSVKDVEIRVLISIIGFLLFGLSVSIDSFTTGIGLEVINNNYLQVSSIFAVISGLFTYLGLQLGIYFNNAIGKYATFFGGVVLVILGVYYLF